jgi:hypothetical protein
LIASLVKAVKAFNDPLFENNELSINALNLPVATQGVMRGGLMWYAGRGFYMIKLY